MQAPRLADWEPRLVAYVQAARADVREGNPAYCALFAAGAAEAVTGENPAKGYRGRYRLVADRLEAEIDRLYLTVPKAFAQRGDLCWHDGSVGVVMGGHALFVGEQPDGTPDLVTVERAAWAKAWGVGHG